MEFLLIWFAIGMFLPVIPTILFFEIYHWIRKTNEIKYPFLKGFLVGLTVGDISRIYYGVQIIVVKLRLLYIQLLRT